MIFFSGFRSLKKFSNRIGNNPIRGRVFDIVHNKWPPFQELSSNKKVRSTHAQIAHEVSYDRKKW